MNSRFNYFSNLTGSPVQRLFSFLSLERRDILLLYTYVVIGSVIGLSIPLFIQMIYGVVIGGRVSTSWIVLIFLLVLAFLLVGALQIMQYSILERMQQRVFAKAALEISERIPRFRVESMLKKYAPELINQFFDVPGIQKGILKFIMSFSTALVQIFFSLVLLAFYHSTFVFYGLFMIIILIILFYFSAPRGMKTTLTESKMKYKVAHWLEELSRSLDIFKMAGYTEMPLVQTDKLVSKYVTARRDHFGVIKSQYRFIIFFKTFFIVGLLVIGGFLVFSGDINLGQFIASEVVIILVMSSVDKLMDNLEGLYDLMTSFEKVGNIMEQPLESDDGISFTDVDNHTGGIALSFKDVSYQFKTSRKPSLDKVSFDIKPGEKVCVMGYGASGKSTLINLAATLIHDFEGTITFNNVTVRNMNLFSLRSYVGENLSNNRIMNGTISENIGMGIDDTSFSDVKNAIDAVGLSDFVHALKDGYDTQLIQDDLTIPDSVVTKINIARSIAEKPLMFLMDEPLQGLQKNDKVIASEYLTNKDQSWTLLVASNDATLASMCDRVLVMKEGKVFDDGTFDEILSKAYIHDIMNP